MLGACLYRGKEEEATADRERLEMCTLDELQVCVCVCVWFCNRSRPTISGNLPCLHMYYLKNDVSFKKQCNFSCLVPKALYTIPYIYMYLFQAIYLFLNTVHIFTIYLFYTMYI